VAYHKISWNAALAVGAGALFTPSAPHYGHPMDKVVRYW
jgi:hypothetical protein